jgi:hypothetical protein
MRTIKLLVATVILSVVNFSVSAQEKAGKKDTTTHTVLYSCPLHNKTNQTMHSNTRQLSKKEQMKLQVTQKSKQPLHAVALNNNHRKCSDCGMNRTMSAKEKMKVNVVNNYQCPMQSTSGDKKEKCPKCDMALTEADE